MDKNVFRYQNRDTKIIYHKSIANIKMDVNSSTTIETLILPSHQETMHLGLHEDFLSQLTIKGKTFK